jgi:hypothetical protein
MKILVVMEREMIIGNKNSIEYFQPVFEEETKDQMKKFEGNKKKKRKKKYMKLWGNCIPLSNYKGIENINVNYMLKRRKLRYKYEVANWKVFGDEKKKKEKETIYKGQIKSTSIKPRERVDQRNSENSAQRCKEHTFDHDSTVDESLVAAEHVDMNINHIGKQSQDIERNEILIHGNTCRTLEIVQSNKSEEYSPFPVIQFKSENQLSMKKAVWEEMFKFIQNNSDEELLHIDLDDPQIMRLVFSDGNWRSLSE